MVKWVRTYLCCMVLLFGICSFSAYGLSENKSDQTKGFYAFDDILKIKVSDVTSPVGIVPVDSSSVNKSYLSDSASNLSDTLLLTPADFFISFEKDSLKKAWNDYLAWLNSQGDSLRTEGAVVVVDPIDEVQFNEFVRRSESLPEDSSGIAQNEMADSVSPDTDMIHKYNPEIGQPRQASKDKYSRFPFHFVVQVAASQTELDSLELSQAYSGPFEIRKIEEEGWYKYQVGVTENYLEALQILKSVSSDGRFLVAYNADSEKLKLWKAVLTQRRDLIHYRVQIAASAIPLSDEEILEIYDGDLKIRIIEEEGWYKYQIDLGRNYKESREKEKAIDVEGAFMVPYLGEEKMPLYNVLRFYRF